MKAGSEERKMVSRVIVGRKGVSESEVNRVFPKVESEAKVQNGGVSRRFEAS